MVLAKPTGNSLWKIFEKILPQCTFRAETHSLRTTDLGDLSGKCEACYKAQTLQNPGTCWLWTAIQCEVGGVCV